MQTENWNVGRPARVRRVNSGRITADMLVQARRGVMMLCLLESTPPEVLDAWRRLVRVLERRAARKRRKPTS